MVAGRKITKIVLNCGGGDVSAAIEIGYWTKKINNLVKKEQKFYKLIDVDEYVCWVGKMPPYNAYNFFTLSPQDMQYFGIDSVTIDDNYFNKIIAYQKKHPEKPFIQYIELDPKIVEGNRPKQETTRPVKGE